MRGLGSLLRALIGRRHEFSRPPPRDEHAPLTERLRAAVKRAEAVRAQLGARAGSVESRVRGARIRSVAQTLGEQIEEGGALAQPGKPDDGAVLRSIRAERSLGRLLALAERGRELLEVDALATEAVSEFRHLEERFKHVLPLTWSMLGASSVPDQASMAVTRPYSANLCARVRRLRAVCEEHEDGLVHRHSRLTEILRARGISAPEGPTASLEEAVQRAGSQVRELTRDTIASASATVSGACRKQLAGSVGDDSTESATADMTALAKSLASVAALRARHARKPPLTRC